MKKTYPETRHPAKDHVCFWCKKERHGSCKSIYCLCKSGECADLKP